MNLFMHWKSSLYAQWNLFRVWPTIFYSNVGRDKNFFHGNTIRIKNKKLECHYLYRTIFNKMIKFPGLTIHFTLPFYWVVTQINRWISAKLKLFYSIKYISQTWINYWFFKIRKYIYIYTYKIKWTILKNHHSRYDNIIIWINISDCMNIFTMIKQNFISSTRHSMCLVFISINHSQM